MSVISRLGVRRAADNGYPVERNSLPYREAPENNRKVRGDFAGPSARVGKISLIRNTLYIDPEFTLCNSYVPFIGGECGAW